MSARVERARAAHYADVLGKVDDLGAEVARLRALCQEAAGYMSAQPMHPLSAEADLYDRLRAAGGGT